MPSTFVDSLTVHNNTSPVPKNGSRQTIYVKILLIPSPAALSYVRNRFDRIFVFLLFDLRRAAAEGKMVDYLDVRQPVRYDYRRVLLGYPAIPVRVDAFLDGLPFDRA